jgi:hypothetical protein
MALSKTAVEQLEDVNLIPVGKLICIVRAAYAAYKCVKAAAGDLDKIAACVETLVEKIEECMNK